MAACCAIGALVIYHLMSLHARLPSFNSTPPGPKQTTTLEYDLLIANSKDARNSRPNVKASRTCRLFLDGLTCQSCVVAVEQALHSTPGVESFSVSLHSLSACITFDPKCVQISSLVAAIEEVGFDVTAQTEGEDWRSQWIIAADLKQETIRKSQQRFHISAAVSALVFGIENLESWYGSGYEVILPHLRLLGLLIATASIALLAAPLHREAYSALLYLRPNSSLLSSAGLLSVMMAAIYHQIHNTYTTWDNKDASFSITSACMLMTVLLGGKVTKSLVSKRSTQFVTLLASAMPETAHLYSSDSGDNPDSSNVPIDLLQLGDTILVLPGTPFPADCKIISGRTSVLETIMKGETSPASVEPGDTVFAGCTNCEGKVVAEVTRVGKDTWLGQALRAVAQASEAKVGLQHSSERLLAFFSALVLAFACSLGIFYIYLGASLEDVLNRVATVLLCACPCTLGLGIPICLMTAASNAHNARILLRPGPQIEKAAAAQAFVFDKTGTLTYGKLQVHQVQVEPHWEKEASSQKLLWQMVGSATRASQHPVSTLLHELSTAKDLELENIGMLENGGIISQKVHPGLGHATTFAVEDAKFEIAIGNIRMMQTQGIYLDAARKVDSGPPASINSVFISVNGQLACTVGYADKVVAESATLVHALHTRGLKTYMMTGDTQQSAQATADQVGIPSGNVHASMLPHEKSALIKRLELQHGPVVMVGDNLNDAAALAASSFGVVVSHRMEETQRSSHAHHSFLLPSLHAEADALLLPLRKSETSHEISLSDRTESSGLHRIIYTLDLAAETSRRMSKVMNWALVYNVIALALASGTSRAFLPSWIAEWVDFSPTTASLSMSLSSVAILFYSLGLQTWSPHNPSSKPIPTKPDYKVELL